MIPQHKSTVCPICEGGMGNLVPLPAFPLGGFMHGTVDQALLYCEPCSHGKLQTVIHEAYLYGAAYASGTSLSGERALGKLAQFIKENTDLAQYDMLLDIGGGDGMLSDLLPGLQGVIVDPHAQGTGTINVYKAFHEAELSDYKTEKKIIVASHTLEHVADVNAFLSKVAKLWREGDRFVISVPELGPMIEQSRLDHVHHEHIHYFSERSLGLLLAKHGFGIVTIARDPMHWNALMVMCDRKRRDVSAKLMSKWAVMNAHTEFEILMRETRLPLGAIGFGASPMTPVLAYHMPRLRDPSYLEFIADNNPMKDGKSFPNFRMPIRSDYEMSGRDVVITAISSRYSCRELMSQAFASGARSVIVPLRVL